MNGQTKKSIVRGRIVVSSDWDIIGKEGLQFFGKMSASVSHEIKNVLAIINENAGLLEDLALMAEKGKAVDMGRFKTVAGKIKTQVSRADDIVKNLNRFAHSSDDFKGDVDVNDALRFVVVLSHRLFDMKGLSVEQVPVDSSVVITTTLFLLLDLLWLCLSFAMESTGDEKKIHLLVEKLDRGARISFSNLKSRGQISEDRFPSAKEKALLNALGARMDINESEGELILLIPEAIEE
jgi:C4-dicarboxylate-specific signal transduction histidine kinase